VNWYPISERIRRREADEEPRISCIVNQIKGRSVRERDRPNRGRGAWGGGGACFAYSESRRGGHCWTLPDTRKQRRGKDRFSESGFPVFLALIIGKPYLTHLASVTSRVYAVSLIPWVGPAHVRFFSSLVTSLRIPAKRELCAATFFKLSPYVLRFNFNKFEFE
jgi:hypothetical protein